MKLLGMGKSNGRRFFDRMRSGAEKARRGVARAQERVEIYHDNRAIKKAQKEARTAEKLERRANRRSLIDTQIGRQVRAKRIIAGEGIKDSKGKHLRFTGQQLASENRRLSSPSKIKKGVKKAVGYLHKRQVAIKAEENKSYRRSRRK